MASSTSSNASVSVDDTMKKNTRAATIVPTIETTRPVIAGHFAPFMNRATMDSTNAIGSSTHAMTGMNGMHANMKPTAATASAMRPSTCGLVLEVGSSPSVITAAPGAAAP